MQQYMQGFKKPELDHEKGKLIFTGLHQGTEGVKMGLSSTLYVQNNKMVQSLMAMEQAQGEEVKSISPPLEQIVHSLMRHKEVSGDEVTISGSCDAEEIALVVSVAKDLSMQIELANDAKNTLRDFALEVAHEMEVPPQDRVNAAMNIYFMIKEGTFADIITEGIKNNPSVNLRECVVAAIKSVDLQDLTKPQQENTAMKHKQ